MMVTEGGGAGSFGAAGGATLGSWEDCEAGDSVSPRDGAPDEFTMTTVASVNRILVPTFRSSHAIAALPFTNFEKSLREVMGTSKFIDSE
jgi:hypothetical protein